MDSIIINGMTIIKMPPEIDKNEHSKIGVYITDGKMKLKVGYKGKNYYFGIQQSLEDAKRIRELADQHIEDGTFEEWYKENQSKYVHTKAKNGVKGLVYIKAREIYHLYVKHNNERFYLDKFKDPEDAALLRAEADRQIENGTFEEWFNEYKNRK